MLFESRPMSISCWGRAAACCTAAVGTAPHNFRLQLFVNQRLDEHDTALEDLRRKPLCRHQPPYSSVGRLAAADPLSAKTSNGTLVRDAPPTPPLFVSLSEETGIANKEQNQAQARMDEERRETRMGLGVRPSGDLSNCSLGDKAPHRVPAMDPTASPPRPVVAAAQNIHPRHRHGAGEIIPSCDDAGCVFGTVVIPSSNHTAITLVLQSKNSTLVLKLNHDPSRASQSLPPSTLASFHVASWLAARILPGSLILGWQYWRAKQDTRISKVEYNGQLSADSEPNIKPRFDYVVANAPTL
ncbi:hypothetical protein DFH06DRAFT_1430091 [Mycena polygramma]|nr:hypothetical protein DFH06DRAFT_1430091 [Mycena polygramma]